MIQERFLEISENISFAEADFFASMDDESKFALTAMTAGVNLILIAATSRQLDGTQNYVHEKALWVIGCLGITVANAILNHQVWT